MRKKAKSLGYFAFYYHIWRNLNDMTYLQYALLPREAFENVSNVEIGKYYATITNRALRKLAMK